MDYGLLKKIIFGTGDIPEGKVLVDPHAHFHKSLDPNEIVQALFEREVGVQAICDYLLESGKPTHVTNYGEFVGKLRNENGLEVIASNGITTKIRRGEKFRF